MMKINALDDVCEDNKQFALEIGNSDFKLEIRK